MVGKKSMKGVMEEIFELEEDAVDILPVSRKGKEKILVALDLIINIVIIVALVIFVRRFLISPFQVFGPSMCNTFNFIDGRCHHGFGEYLIVNKAVYQNFFDFRFEEPSRGDIIIFRPPGNIEDFYIKRVIGLPEETVRIRDGEIFVKTAGAGTEKKLREPYLKNGLQTLSHRETFTVPEGHYFLLGDNRSESSDSRTCFGTSPNACEENGTYFLPLENIQGKAWISLWPFSKIRFIEHVEYEF